MQGKRSAYDRVCPQRLTVSRYLHLDQLPSSSSRALHKLSDVRIMFSPRSLKTEDLLPLSLDAAKTYQDALSDYAQKITKELNDLDKLLVSLPLTAYKSSDRFSRVPQDTATMTRATTSSFRSPCPGRRRQPDY